MLFIVAEKDCVSGMANRDYYEVLGIDKNATEADIKRAYRRMARKYHPDLNKEHPKEAEENFKKVNEAYHVLSDADKRAQYDQMGHDAFRQAAQNGGGPGPGGFGGTGGFDFSSFGGGAGGFDFGDIFDMFGGGGRRSRNGPKQGADLRYDMEITLREAASGIHKTFTVTKNETCDHCHGDGAEPGSSVDICHACHGTGQQRIVRNSPFGQMVNVVTCPDCGGTGKIIKNKCSRCHGSGTTRKQKKLEVNIPAGADTGVRMRISGEGEPGKRGGPKGDLYVYIYVRSDPDFERQGDDLYCRVPVSFPTAALGSTIQVKTLDKQVELKIPAGTQSGTRFRISKEGMPRLQSSYKGDLYVEVKVVVPKKLKENQKEALLNYANVSGEDVTQYKGKGSWLDKIIDKIKSC